MERVQGNISGCGKLRHVQLWLCLLAALGLPLHSKHRSCCCVLLSKSLLQDRVSYSIIEQDTAPLQNGHCTQRMHAEATAA